MLVLASLLTVHVAMLTHGACSALPRVTHNHTVVLQKLPAQVGMLRHAYVAFSWC